METIISLYGPLPSKAEIVLQDILYQLDVLSKEVQEEKVLGDNIKINSYVTPYKKATTKAKEQIAQYHHNLVMKNSESDPAILSQEFQNFKKMMQIDLSKALKTTEDLIYKLRENVSTSDIKKKINDKVKNRLKEAISNVKDKVINNNRYFDLTEKIKKAYTQGKLKTIQEDYHKKLENELNFVGECLLDGDLDLLCNHKYFQENPEDLKHYYPDNKHLNKRLLKVFLKTYVRKITADDNLIQDKTTLYKRMIAHIIKLCEAETLRIFSHSRAHALGQYIKKRVEEEGRTPLALEERSKEQRLHNRIKRYLMKQAKSAGTLEQHNQPEKKT